MFHRLLRWLADPGPDRGWWRLVPRLAAALVVLPAGVGKFLNYDAYVDRFERWGFGAAPGAFAVLTGTVEVVAALLVLLGLVPRLGALAIVGVMLGALTTAGRIDGGQNIWLPLVVIACAGAVAVVGAGPIRLSPAVGARRDGPRTG